MYEHMSNSNKKKTLYLVTYIVVELIWLGHIDTQTRVMTLKGLEENMHILRLINVI